MQNYLSWERQNESVRNFANRETLVHELVPKIKNKILFAAAVSAKSVAPFQQALLFPLALQRGFSTPFSYGACGRYEGSIHFRQSLLCQ